jgi:predicted nucleic acid-binding protein
VAINFLDTSALVKRYDTREAGSARVRVLCRRASGNALALCDIARPELASALGRKLRLGEIDRAELRRSWRRFLDHARYEYRFVPLEPSIYARAAQLVFDHPLFAYDAVQVACALEVRPLLAAVDPDFLFVTADQRQAAAAQAEGLPVELVG